MAQKPDSNPPLCGRGRQGWHREDVVREERGWQRRLVAGSCVSIVFQVCSGEGGVWVVRRDRPIASLRLSSASSQ